MVERNTWGLTLALTILAAYSSTTSKSDGSHDNTHPVTCDFESSGLCSWDGYTVITGYWHRVSGRDNNATYGPFKDHTLQLDQGSFLTLQKTAGPKRRCYDATLSKRKVKLPPEGMCFSFWYFMEGDEEIKLRLNAHFDGKLKVKPTESTFDFGHLSWSKRGSQGPDWRYGQVFVPRIFSHFQVVFEASICSKLGPSVALDDFRFTSGPCPVSHDCDFDNGFCAYSQSTDDNFDWLLAGDIDKDKSDEIPDNFFRDNVRGGFSYINVSSPLNEGDTAVLLSPEFTNKKPVCFRFWYNVQGSVNLDVSQSVDGQSSRSLWTKSGGSDKAKDWQLAMITVLGDQRYRLALKATIGVDDNEDRWVSVDDIDTVPGSCHDTTSCDFEDTACSWRHDPVGDHPGWVRATVGKESNGHAVRKDHTLGTKYGKFLILNGTSSNLAKLKSKLISVPLAPHLPYCLNFWYIIESRGQIDISYMADRSSGSLYKVTSPTGTEWVSFRETIRLFDTWSSIVIEGVNEEPQHGAICLDDLHVQEGNCEVLGAPSRRASFHCSSNGLGLSQGKLCDFSHDCPDGEEEEMCGYECDFEDENCKWTILTNYHSAWNIESGVEHNGTMGPENDHTTGERTGRFLHAVDSAFFHYRKIISPLLKRSTDNCRLSFFAYVTDPKAWIITIKKIVGDRTETRFASYELEDKTWNKITVSVGHTITPFLIQIEFQSRLRNTQAISLDDISFKDCDFFQSPGPEVNEDVFYCANGVETSSSRVCDYVNDCVDNSDESRLICSNYTRCDFDTDLCPWRQETVSDDSDWSRLAADGKHYPYVGPEFDHTTFSSSGGVLELAAWTGSPGDKAWLLSPVLMPTENCTLTLHLFLGRGRHDLFNIYTRNDESGDLTRHMSSRGEPGRFWSFKSLTLTSSSPFQIVLEGVRGYGWYVEIALDDVSLSPECIEGQWESTEIVTTLTSLPEVGTSQPPTMPILENATTPMDGCQHTGAWQCLDGSLCIHTTQRCDFQTQCLDQSDEMDCGRCDFANSNCGWTDMSKNIDGWILENTSVDSDDNQLSLTLASTNYTADGLYPTNQSIETEQIRNVSEPVENISYISARHSDQDQVGVAVLASPVFGSTSSSCTMAFKYKDSGYGSLSLYLYTGTPASYTNTQEGLFLWRSVHASPSWAKATVSIASLASGFHLVFKSQPVSFAASTMTAIDDVTFGPSCGDDSRWTRCLANEFTCENSNECKPNHARCDLTKDCPLGEDEQGCDTFRLGDFSYRNIFSPDKTGDFKWILQKAKQNATGPMPTADHTGNGPKGRFLFMNSTSMKKDVEIARVISYIMHPTSKGDCYLRFFYWSTGDRSGFVNIFTVLGDGTETKIWSMDNKKVDNWTKVVLPLKSQDDFGVVIEGIRRRRFRGAVAIDDVTISPECHYDDRYPFKVRSHSTNRFRLTCDFDFKRKREIRYKYLRCSKNCTFDDDGMCGWTQKNRKKSVPWVIETLANVSKLDPRVERSQDHVLMVGQDAGKNGKRPKLLHSPIVRNAANGCTFSFKYYYVGRVSIFYISLRTLREIERVYYEGPEWDKRKGPSGKWNSLSVSIPPNTGEFRIVIYLFLETKSVGNSFFMMDNFTFSGCHTASPPKLCPVRHSLCDNGYCVSHDRLCDLENDCGDWSDESGERCSMYQKFTFEESLMGWKRDLSTGYRWSLRKGWKRRGRFNFGRPAYDHTTLFKDGHYLSTMGQIGKADKAVLVYEMDPLAYSCNIAFWYQINCVHRNTCGIYVKTKTLHGPKNLIQMFTSESQALRWEKGSFRVMVNESFKIIFEGILDGDRYSTLNIDDIIFSPNCVSHQRQKETPAGTNANPVTASPCSRPDAFHCATGDSCIFRENVCDFNSDCLDGSDERHCPINTVCEFDTDTCGWWSVRRSPSSWAMTKDLSQRDMPVPPVSGHYVFLKLPKLRQNVRAMPDYYSHRFKSAGPGCVIRFQYYLDFSGHPERNALTLQMSMGREVVGPLWKTGRADRQWREAVVGIGSRSQSFFIFFRLYSEPDSDAFVALDKIQYEDCATVFPNRRGDCSETDNRFQCRNGDCIADTFICNRHIDCPDGSDEAEDLCRDVSVIDFEDLNPFRLFVHEGNEGLAWQVSRRSHPFSMPEGLGGIDHTTWTNRGHFLVLHGQPATLNTGTASIVSRTYLSPEKACTIRFHAMIPRKTESITISYRTTDESKMAPDDKTVAVNGLKGYGSFWQTLTASIATDRPFRLVITGTVGGPGGVIGLDDVIFGPGCHPAP